MGEKRGRMWKVVRIEVEMVEWLGRNRLSRHAGTIADVVGT